MRKLLAICAALILGASVLSAQEFNPTGRWYVSLQGGPMYQSSENTFAYRWEGYGSKLLTYTAAVAAGYNFNETWGLRGSVSFGQNRGAGNYKQSHDRFYPYDFKNISGFCDLVLDFNGLNAVEPCRLYLIGALHKMGVGIHPQALAVKHLAVGALATADEEYKVVARGKLRDVGHAVGY